MCVQVRGEFSSVYVCPIGTVYMGLGERRPLMARDVTQMALADTRNDCQSVYPVTNDIASPLVVVDLSRWPVPIYVYTSSSSSSYYYYYFDSQQLSLRVEIGVTPYRMYSTHGGRMMENPAHTTCVSTRRCAETGIPN